MSRNRCETTCDCGLDFSYRPETGKKIREQLIDGAEYLRLIGWIDCPYEVDGYHERGTLFAKIVCPLCRTEYLGWFCPPTSPRLHGPEWKIYDTSYWSTYNDEPGEEDRRNWRDPVEALRVLDEKTEREKGEGGPR